MGGKDSAYLIDRLRRLGFDLAASQDEREARFPCILTESCAESHSNSLALDAHTQTFACSDCNNAGTFALLVELVERAKAQDFSAQGEHQLGAISVRAKPLPAEIQDAEFVPVEEAQSFSVAPIKVDRPLVLSEPKVKLLTDRVPTEAEIAAKHRAERDERRRGFGEKLIITTLALVSLLAGLIAAGMSGFANYQAFSNSVADPLQGQIWGWTGVIAAIISFGGFTLFYWHMANRRRWEGLRSLLFALIGAGTSILGTELYIRANNQSAEGAVAAASQNRAVLETQLADWRRQLDGIPPETRSVEGLEAYIAEVERVGRTDQKPYRDARNELGLARRRDDLQARIEAANAELLGVGRGNILLTAEARTELPSWFFAVILEIFASQGTSIGLVALLLLYGRKNPA